MGLEPTHPTWKAGALPLRDRCMQKTGPFGTGLRVYEVVLPERLSIASGDYNYTTLFGACACHFPALNLPFFLFLMNFRQICAHKAAPG